MADIEATRLLAQMRSMRIAAQAQPQATQPAGQTNGADFSKLLKNAMNEVNELQQTAGGMAKSFELGNADVDLAQVMLSLQKANLSFQAMTQVRNKLLSAYKEVMSMPV